MKKWVLFDLKNVMSFKMILKLYEKSEPLDAIM